MTQIGSQVERHVIDGEVLGAGFAVHDGVEAAGRIIRDAEASDVAFREIGEEELEACLMS